jgi:AcrR family transcriptional regulator
MARTPDPKRRAELLDGAVDYAIEHGLSDLTLRPLADALGVLPNTLVHHFGSKEQLLSEILNGVRDRLRAIRGDGDAVRPRESLREVWAWTAAPARSAFFRSFFEAYGMALRRPESFRSFLDRVVADWLAHVPQEQLAEATLELAVVRGLLLDLLTTGERARVEDAFVRFSDA